MNESFLVNIVFNFLIVGIISSCLSLLFSSSNLFLNKLYKIILWLIAIGFYEPDLNYGISSANSSLPLKKDSFIQKYQILQQKFNGVPNFAPLFAKFSILLSNVILFGIIFFRWVTSGYFPISNLYESLMFLTWCLLTLLILAGYKIGFSKTSILGCVLLPLCLFLVGFSSKVLPMAMQSATH